MKFLRILFSAILPVCALGVSLSVARAATAEIAMSQITGRYPIEIRAEADAKGKKLSFSKPSFCFKPGSLVISAIAAPGKAVPVHVWMVTNGKAREILPENGKIVVNIPETDQPSATTLRISVDDTAMPEWIRLNKGKGSFKIQWGVNFGIESKVRSVDEILDRKVQVVVPYRLLLSTYHTASVISVLKGKRKEVTEDLVVWTWFRKIECAAYIDGVRSGSVSVRGNARVLSLPFRRALWDRNPPVVIMFNSEAGPARGKATSRS